MCSACPPVSIWDEGLSWESQPPELKALGKRRAERVILRLMDNAVTRIDAEIIADHATMTPEEITAEEQAAHEYLLTVASEYGPTKRFDNR